MFLAKKVDSTPHFPPPSNETPHGVYNVSSCMRLHEMHARRYFVRVVMHLHEMHFMLRGDPRKKETTKIGLSEKEKCIWSVGKSFMSGVGLWKNVCSFSLIFFF